MITVLTIPIPTETDDRTTKRQCERTATLSLAQQVAGPQATIAHHPDGAPYIPGFCRHISVTHCRTIAAMAVADIPHIGIDAETSRPQLQRVASKYLSASELPFGLQHPTCSCSHGPSKKPSTKPPAHPDSRFTISVCRTLRHTPCRPQHQMDAHGSYPTPCTSLAP